MTTRTPIADTQAYVTGKFEVTAEGQPRERAYTEDGKIKDLNRILEGISRIQSARCNFICYYRKFLLDKISQNHKSW
jgi:hypothetical protein